MNLKQIARILRRYLSCYISAKMLQDGILISGDIYPVLSRLGFSAVDDSLFVNGPLIAKWSHNRLSFQEK